MEQTSKIFTAAQAVDYLQVHRQTIYRYIRAGRLVASKRGRTYRVSKRRLDLLLWATRTRTDVTLRAYTGEEIEEFIALDRLDAAAQAVVNRCMPTHDEHPHLR